MNKSNRVFIIVCPLWIKTQLNQNEMALPIKIDVKLYIFTTDGVSISTFKIPGLFAISELEQMWAIICQHSFSNQLYSLVKPKISPRLIFDESCVLAYLEKPSGVFRVINAEPPKFDTAIEHFAKTFGWIGYINTRWIGSKH